jgi:hypothetical protein
VLLLLPLPHVITSHQCINEAIVLVTLEVLQPSPLKESRPEILGRDPLGVPRRCAGMLPFCFSQVSLVNCSSNVILFATSEGSPFKVIFKA